MHYFDEQFLQRNMKVWVDVKYILFEIGSGDCVKSVRIRSYSGLHLYRFSRAFEMNTERSVFSPNVGKCEKNADQNNSEYGLFLSSGFHYMIRTDIWLCCLHSKLKSLHWVWNKYLNHANEVFENFQPPYNWGLLLYKITF